GTEPGLDPVDRPVAIRRAPRRRHSVRAAGGQRHRLGHLHRVGLLPDTLGIAVLMRRGGRPGMPALSFPVLGDIFSPLAYYSRMPESPLQSSSPAAAPAGKHSR